MSISPAPNAHGAEGDSLKDSTKIVGLSLAIGSGLLIGASFVFKKKGLINCTKHGMLAGEGHDYLKSVMWWTGMLMMVAGEICNFVAYAFVQPILVTPLGALSVVICAILSSIFLKERLNLQGKVGCAQCIIGATIIVLHAPEQTSVKTIQEFAHFMKQPLFLVWMFVIILLSLWLIIKAGPRWGKDHMMVYIGVCSLIGSLSVVSTQALGAAIVHNISTGEPQFNTWFTYFVIVFMVITLLTEINYLNKALNLFNTAMVTPTYYVTFTSTTIITSAILYQGFHASVVAILTVCFGFLVICGGVLLLQTSKPVVPLHVPGSSSSGIIGGTITYDDIEPNAADMRASPFSSIRRISRDLRQPSIIHGTSSSVYQGSPLNPMLQRKRRASNAAQQRSRPQSVLAGHGHLAPPGGTGTAGSATAFYPSSTGAYSTMVMGPNGSQVRLQLCEIVISDEKNETQSRYQVYRPIPPLGDGGTTTGYRQHTLQSRTGVHTSDSRSSSVRFGDNVARPSQEENEKEEYHHQNHQQATPVQKYPSPISGSLFVPPKVTASHSSTAAAGAAAPTAPGSPSSPTGPSGPLAVGGSFYGRPRFRSPSTSTAASGDIMEINDPSHAGRTVVSIEPVQQQPLYSLYVPPPPAGTAGTHHHQRPTSPLASAPLQPVDSTSSSSSSASSSTATNNVNALGDSVQQEGHDEVRDGTPSAMAAGTSVTSTKADKPHGIFGNLFSKGPLKKNSSKNLNPSGTSLLPLTTTLDSTDGSPPGSPLSSPSSPLPPPPQIVFNRANHPTRISEGEEEEDAEDLKPQSG
ncbi:hypothetical protein BGZ70_005623 [Mortierella alpina]|uniref:DUF803-domain-containing protein n=1 Tax=Mortierella alpina TaxID=64518 RepID=A0A9P6JF35_MORAP|nr:hypothetical protein BGZ70_005623 [Mortierella alpina]